MWVCSGVTWLIALRYVSVLMPADCHSVVCTVGAVLGLLQRCSLALQCEADLGRADCGSAVCTVRLGRWSTAVC